MRNAAGVSNAAVKFHPAIVRLDSGGEMVETEPEGFDERAAEGQPVHVRRGGRCADHVPVAPENFAT